MRPKIARSQPQNRYSPGYQSQAWYKEQPTTKFGKRIFDEVGLPLDDLLEQFFLNMDKYKVVIKQKAGKKTK